MDKGEPETTLEYLNKSIEMNPNSATAYKYRADIYDALGQKDKADEDRAKSRTVNDE